MFTLYSIRKYFLLLLLLKILNLFHSYKILFFLLAYKKLANLLKHGSFILIKIKAHFKNLTNDGLKINKLFCLLYPLKNDLFVGRLFYLKTLLRLELFKRYNVQNNKTKTEHIRFEWVA